MKNKKIIISFIIFLLFIIFSNICMAKDLDRINKYYVTVDPRKDGSLDMTYYFEWKVLDSDSEGPLEWVKIGIPNDEIDMLKANTDNIKSIKYYKDKGDYIRIDFKKAHFAGEVINFSFSFHQSYMYTIDGELARYKFTPGWFDDIIVDEMVVFWNADGTYSSSSKNINSDNYYIWSTSLRKGEKLKTNVAYSRYSMNFAEDKQYYEPPTRDRSEDLIILIIAIFIVVVAGLMQPMGYRRHRGFGYGRSSYYDDSYYDSSYHSSCVSSCACACACAGGGRAGCSKKDFYGTTIRTQKLNKVIKDKEK